jgi:hypothetical protein
VTTAIACTMSNTLGDTPGHVFADNPNIPNHSHQQRHLRYVKFKPDCATQNRFELFLLDEGQKKVEWKDETRKSRYMRVWRISVR